MSKYLLTILYIVKAYPEIFDHEEFVEFLIQDREISH